MNSHNPPPHTHTRENSSILLKAKSAYFLWYSYHTILPKIHRYSLGQKIDNLLIQIIEIIATALFLSKEEKFSYVRLAIKKMDVLKILLMVLWETKSLEDKKYIALSEALEEVGRMLGGWYGNLVKQNSPDKKSGEK